MNEETMIKRHCLNYPGPHMQPMDGQAKRQLILQIFTEHFYDEYLYLHQIHFKIHSMAFGM